MKPFPALSLALLLAAAAIASANLAPPPPAIGCAVELVALSTCLPHLAAPPNDPMPVPSAACCATFFSALDGAGGGVSCLCHLVRDPLLLGFPINASRIVALFSNCGASDDAAASSFAETCRDAPMLPPLTDVSPADTGNQQSGVAEPPEAASADPEQKKPHCDAATETRSHTTPELVIITSSAPVLLRFRSGKGLLLTGPVVFLPLPVFILCLLWVL